MNLVCASCGTLINLETSLFCSNCRGSEFSVRTAVVRKRIIEEGEAPEVHPLYLDHYLDFEKRLNPGLGDTLIEAQVLFGEGQSQNVIFVVSPEDKDFFQGLVRIIIKAYHNLENRRGPRAMSQDNPVLMDYGAGPESTVSLFNLVAQRVLGSDILLYHQGKGAHPRNENWLDLRRENLAIADVEVSYAVS